MKDQELHKLWQQIDQQFEQNDDLEPTDYLASQGVSDQPLDSLNQDIQHLVTQTFQPGELTSELLQSKYRILEQLDSGGQSDVYLAERSDGVYEQTLVIKYIANRFEQAELKKQFIQEMQLLADLRHPGVVTILDGNITEDGHPWLVLEYIKGPHIDAYCRDHRLDDKAVVNLVMNLCDTLQFVHRRGVLHKDLKPSNVLVKQINGVPFPVLIDFGIAMQANQQPSEAMGTYGFAAPEQMAGESVDQRTDLYALGMLFGQLLLCTQSQPPTVKTAQELRQALKQAQVPSELQTVVGRLTASRPADRYQSADALRSDMNQWLLGFPLSFDNHKLSKVLVKSIKRRPWTYAVLSLGLCLGLFFAVKYTRDVQHLQQLTAAEKADTDELMNFMLGDLYLNLERIGRVDVLQTVADKSVAHLAKQDPLTLDEEARIQTAKAYLNTGQVFDYLELSEKAANMFEAADYHLKIAAGDPNFKTRVLPLLAQLKVYQSQVLSRDGQEDSTQQVLLEAVDAMQQLLSLEPNHDPKYLWEAHLELGYHLMEYARPEAALEHINESLKIAAQQLAKQPDHAKWLYSSSQSHQSKAWYEIDFGTLAAGINEVKSAIELSAESIRQDPNDLKKQNNLRILHNQLAYFLLEAGQVEAAREAALVAVDLGAELKLKAPEHREFDREQSFSFSTAGEIYQSQGDLEQALNYYLKGLVISKRNHQDDPSNYSVANDLAVDTLLVADLRQQLGQTEAAREQFITVEQLMDPIHKAEPNNKYYAHTLLVAKLQLQKTTEARELFNKAKSNDMVDGKIESLVEKNQLDWLAATAETTEAEP